jgi:putative endonuclease
MPFFVYILYADAHQRYYIGQTSDVISRLSRHNNGMEKSTAPYKPWRIILFIEKSSRGEAMILERKLKNLNTEDLERFIIKYGGMPGPGAGR